ncbi:alpha/beta fold hydrolase [Microbacterium sp. C23T]
MSPIVHSAADRALSLVVNGARVCYFDSEANPSERSTIVLIHGTGGSTDAHFPFLYPMLARDQRVVAVEFAASEGAQRIDVAQLGSQVSSVIDELGLDDVTLVGYSLGAVIAAHVAATHPGAVSRLVLISGWARTDAQQRLRNDLWRELRGRDEESARRFTVFTAYGPGHVNKLSASQIDELAASIHLDEFFDMQMDLNRRIDIRDQLELIRAETLIVAGADDQMVPRHHADELFGSVLNARLVELSAGHAIVTERPAELMHLINDFTSDPTRWPVGSVLPRVRP